MSKFVSIAALAALSVTAAEPSRPALRIVLVGDSIMAAWPAGLCRGAINMGVPSATTRDLLRRAREIEAERADVIVVMAGVNDIAMGIPASETAANVRALARLGSRSIVHHVLQVTADYPRPGYPNSIAAINAAIGEAVTVPLEGSRRHYLGDGIHLKPAAYAVWRDMLRDAGVCK